ncbi:MAG TPA: hypothetical protein VE988_21270 [Gemmataceae bacterium]|nr:hypothetical protein [Gemmataceae bacterium]
MTPEGLKDLLHKQPFEPFRLVQSDGTGYEVRHPDFLMVGIRQAVVGLPLKSDPTLFDRMVTLDLLHINRVEPLAHKTKSGKQNGSGKTT